MKVLSIYVNHFFMEHFLPAEDNRSYEILLDADYAKIDKNLLLKLEVVEGEWFLLKDPNYRITENNEIKEKAQLEDKKIFHLYTQKDEVIIMIREKKEAFYPLQKYRLDLVDTVTVGCEEDNMIVCKDLPFVSKHHLEIKKEGEKYNLYNKSSNGTYVNGERTDGKKELSYGDYINVLGFWMVFLNDVLAIDETENIRICDSFISYVPGEQTSAQAPSFFINKDEEKICYRIGKKYNEDVFHFVKQEEQGETDPLESVSLLNLLSLFIPVCIGFIGMIYGKTMEDVQTGDFIFKGGAVISFAFLIVALGYCMAVKRKNRIKSHNTKQKELEYKQKLTEELKSWKEKKERIEEERYPDCDTCAQYNENSKELWARKPGEDNYLVHRIGSAVQDGFAILKDQGMDIEPWMEEKKAMLSMKLPVCIDFEKCRSLYVTSKKNMGTAREFAAQLVTQIAANHSYTEVKAAFVYNEYNQSEQEVFSSFRWLPHTWSSDRKARYIAKNKSEMQDVFRSLAKEKAPVLFLFFTHPDWISSEMLAAVHKTRETKKVILIYISKEDAYLEAECQIKIECNEEKAQLISLTSYEQPKTFDMDCLKASKREAFVRRLAGIKVIEEEKSKELKEEIDYFQLMNIENVTQLSIQKNWEFHKSYKNIKVLLGQKAAEEPFYLNLSEKEAGPHGLIAGTTGSGKSELVQTLLLSLAVQYHPDDVEFFIIDYKGGGLSSLFTGIPHLVGQISNLSGNEQERALLAIKSENRRRQMLFARTGVNHIDEYQNLYHAQKINEAISHLFIIVDEFAELKKETPEFLEEMISLSRIGRSLGIHLILATQKPKGTIDHNIFSNARFHICLRVQEEEDSIEMLKNTDACNISQPGRAICSIGNSMQQELFQSAYSGALWNEEGLQRKKYTTMLGNTGEMKNEYGRTIIAKTDKEQCKTQFELVKEEIIKNADAIHYKKKKQLWLPPLPKMIALPEPEHGIWNKENKIFAGMLDCPKKQTRYDFCIEKDHIQNTCILGPVSSGKTTLLQTIAYSAILSYSPEDIQFYILDYGNKNFQAFAQAPHVGGILYDGEENRISHFTTLLLELLEERKRNFIEGKGKNRTTVCILIDNYELFLEKADENNIKDIEKLAREGMANGIYMILSAKGFGLKALTRQMEHCMKTYYCMAKTAWEDCVYAYKTNKIPHISNKIGRGMALYGEEILEFQTSLSEGTRDEYERFSKIQKRCMKLKEEWNGKRPVQLPKIPQRPVWSEYKVEERTKKLLRSKEILPIGYDRKSALPTGIVLKDTYCYVIAGGRRSGKSNLMRICIQSALEKDSRIGILDSEEKEYAAYERSEQIEYAAGERQIFEFFAKLVPVFRERNKMKQNWIAMDMDEPEIYERMKKEIPYFIFISDLQWFFHMIDHAKADMTGFMENILEKGRLHNIYFIGVLSIEKRKKYEKSAAFDLFVEDGNGIHLGGKIMEDSVLRLDSVPYKKQNRAEKPGIGIASETLGEEQTREIIIPLARR